MKRLSFVILITAISTLSSLSRAQESGLQLLLNAKNESGLTLNEKAPFQLEVDFTAQQKLLGRGHLSLKWKSKDQWWRYIQLDEFKEIDIRNGGWLYTTRNDNSTPVRVRQLIQLLQYAEDAKDLDVDKETQSTEYGFPVDCMRVKKRHTKVTAHQICLNGSHEISSDTWWDLPDSPTREEFADYFDFAGHRYPRSLQLVENGSRVIKASIKDLSVNTFNDALLAKPEGAIERRQCDDWTPAKALKTPDPPYPPSASHNGTIGDSIVAMTVLADGTATDFQLIGSASHAMDQSTLDTLKKWKFKPAMCGKEPVVSDVEVIVSFRVNSSLLNPAIPLFGESRFF